MKDPVLLIIDDDAGLRNQLKWHFSESYDVVLAEDGGRAIDVLRLNEPDVVILDLGLPPEENGVGEGFRTMRKIFELSPGTKVIVVTGANDMDHAIRAVSMGVFDYYEKPVDTRVLDLIVDRAFHMGELERCKRFTTDTTAAPLEGLVTSHPGMLAICDKLGKIARTDVTCSICGESGTGKEVFARAVHALSPRKGAPFVPINCAAIPEDLIESELFGHEKGSFTGASSRAVGKVESAQGGTLFLDEIGDMPLAAQAKLLRFIQERVIERVGGRVEIPVDVRIICATNKDLRKMVEDGTFREDLYFRVCEIVVEIPPLRDRGEDKLLLARHYMKRYADEYRRDIVNFDDAAIGAIEDYDWPGNVRELIGKVKNGVIMADGKFVGAADLGFEKASDMAFNLKQVRESAERSAIVKALTISGGKITSAAKLLGVTRPTLYDLVKRYGIAHERSTGEPSIDDVFAAANATSGAAPSIAARPRV